MFATVVIAVAIAAVVVTWTVAWSFRQGEAQLTGNDVLLGDRRQKIAEYSNVDTIVLGDSSAGNLIDEALFSELTNTRTANLTLSGGFGYAGSFNMLRMADARFDLRNVLIIYTPGMPLRGASYLGYYRTKPAGEEDGLSLLQRLKFEWKAQMNATNLRAVLRGILEPTATSSSRQAVMMNDYYAQGQRLDEVEMRAATNSTDWENSVPNKRDLVFLMDIASYCQEQKLNCVYAHSVMPDVSCGAAANYFQRSLALIAEIGLKTISASPLCIEVSHFGDSDDHIAPPYKSVYTREFATLAAGYLR